MGSDLWRIGHSPCSEALNLDSCCWKIAFLAGPGAQTSLVRCAFDTVFSRGPGFPSDSCAQVCMTAPA